MACGGAGAIFLYIFPLINHRLYLILIILIISIYGLERKKKEEKKERKKREGKREGVKAKSKTPRGKRGI